MQTIKRLHTDSAYKRVVEVRCDCGKIFRCREASIRSGNTKSCGCYRDMIRSQVDHGEGTLTTETAEHRSWRAMKARCTNPHNDRFKVYGGRGIKVCLRWLRSYKNFLSDMGRKPGSAYSLDRVNNDGNYEPSNCRWATAGQQAKHKQKPRRNYVP